MRDALELAEAGAGRQLRPLHHLDVGRLQETERDLRSLNSGAPRKKNYHLPRAQLENADLDRIINSTEVQVALKPKLEAPKAFSRKVNTLKSKSAMASPSPYVAERASVDKAPDAMEGLSHRKAACYIALCTNSHLKHLAFGA